MKKINLLKFIIMILSVFVFAFMIHVSSYVYSGYNVNSITQEMYCSEDNEVHLMFNSNSSLNYIIDGESYFLKFTLENGHIKAYESTEEDTFINFYFIKKGILDTKNNVFLIPVTIE